jgi:hypothetical protein
MLVTFRHAQRNKSECLSCVKEYKFEYNLHALGVVGRKKELICMGMKKHHGMHGIYNPYIFIYFTIYFCTMNVYAGM